MHHKTQRSSHVGNEVKRGGGTTLERDDRENLEEVAFQWRPDEQESITRKSEVRPRLGDSRTAGTGWTQDSRAGADEAGEAGRS